MKLVAFPNESSLCRDLGNLQFATVVERMEQVHHFRIFDNTSVGTTLKNETIDMMRLNLSANFIVAFKDCYIAVFITQCESCCETRESCSNNNYIVSIVHHLLLV